MTTHENGDQTVSTYPDTEAVDQDVDPRIIAMHRVVDLERQHDEAEREAEQRQKMAMIIREELREARDDLAGLLGYPMSGNAKAMTSEMAKSISVDRYAR